MHSSFYCYIENDKIANRTIRLHGHKVIMCITAWLIVQPLNILPGTDITFAFYHSTLVSIPPQSSLCHSPSELSVAWVFPALFVLPAWPVWPMELVDGATGLVADSTVQHGSTQLSGRSDGVSKTLLMSLHGGQGGHVGKQISSHHWLSKKYEYAYRHTHTHTPLASINLEDRAAEQFYKAAWVNRRLIPLLELIVSELAVCYSFGSYLCLWQLSDKYNHNKVSQRQTLHASNKIHHQ